MEADFSGYATKVGLECSDGHTILAHAFRDQDGEKVPLMWQHMHDGPENVIGHAVLENREDGVYAYGFFNDTPTAKIAKELVVHGDIRALSIWANKVIKHGMNVVKGSIKEVSLVLAGANPGASIMQVNIAHGDGSMSEAPNEYLIFMDQVIQHSDEGDDMTEENDTDEIPSVQEVWDSMTEAQKNLTRAMVVDAREHPEAIAHSDDEGDEEDPDSEDDESDDENDNQDESDSEDDASDDADSDDESEEIVQHSQEGIDMTRNIFEMNGSDTAQAGPKLSHDQISTIFTDAKKLGSLKESILAHADEYGITDIDLLFPDAKATSNSPEFLKRRTEWVASVIDGVKNQPFARIKTLVADITAEEARALGYVKGNLKKEEIIELLKRTTDPTTVYKKQKLDRDDLLDITDFDVVAWLRAEMRLMIEEELARAILIGDGRSTASEEKIRDPRGSNSGAGIRSILHDNDMYSAKVVIDSSASTDAKIEALIRARADYRGTGEPVFYTTQKFLTDMLLTKDRVGRRIYDSRAAVAAALEASAVVPVEVMETIPSLVGIYVSLQDYTVGSNSGGQLTMFDDFDIDYNQYKYLIETRLSGALTKPKSAVVVSIEEGTETTPVSPSFDGETNTISIPNTTGIDYLIDGETVTGSKVISQDTEVRAVAQSGYYIPAGTTTNWTFVYTSA